MRAPFRIFALGSGLLLAGCAGDSPHGEQPAVDPAVADVIMAPLLADPDLVSLDRRFAVFSDPGPLNLSIPPEDFAAPTIAAARAEARDLLDGASPPVQAEGGVCEGCDATFVDERAVLLGSACAGKLQPGLEWSLRLPRDVPVYPKSHLRDAAGSDGQACPSRAASFTAPVPAAEVKSFYGAIAARAGYALAPAGPNAFVGRKGKDRIGVIVRTGSGGFAQFDLLVSG